jgi:uncharacterized protein YndB with AHSA1/START domain
MVEKSVVINKPRQDIFDYLKYTRNQENFSIWNMADPDKKTSFHGTDGTEGFIYSWESKVKNVGASSQKITKMVDGDRIEYELRFERPMKNTAHSKFILEEKAGDQTLVNWNFKGPNKFPMTLLTGFFRRLLGRDMSQSLENLKFILEN